MIKKVIVLAITVCTIVAALSIIECANLAIVFPEHGATIIISVKCLGPIGSASCIV